MLQKFTMALNTPIDIECKIEIEYDGDCIRLKKNDDYILETDLEGLDLVIMELTRFRDILNSDVNYKEINLKESRPK